MSRDDGCLTDEQANSSQGCGAGTPSACYALVKGPVCNGGFACGYIVNRTIAELSGLRQGWRVNVDPSYGKTWCPFGVFRNSKTA